MKKFVFILFITHFSLLIVYAQQPTLEWVRRYPDSLGAWGQGRAITIDNLGSIYVAGTVDVVNNYDYCVIKYSTSGNVMWQKLYVGNYNEWADAIAVDRNLNVIVTGSGSQPGTSRDYLTIKYDSMGNEQWIKFYNGFANGEDVPKAMVIDDANNIYITGQKSYGGNYFVYCTIKYNTLGEELWVRDFGPPSSAAGPNAMVIDNSSNLYITGMLNNHATTLSCDSSGNFRWSHQYTDLSYGNALALDETGNLYVTGRSGVSLGDQFLTIKYTTVGTVQWVRHYRYCDTALCYSESQNITVDRMENIIVSGVSSTNSGSRFVFTIIKYTNNGDLIWIRNKIPKPGTTIFGPKCEMSVDPFSNIYITGDVPITQRNSYYTFKYDSSGALKWSVFFGGTHGNGSSPEAIITDYSGNVFLTGSSQAIDTSINKMTTIKYSQLIGLILISSNIPQQYKLEQNYPNPFNPVTRFEFKIAGFGLVKLKIYDMLGREIATVVDQELNQGIYEASWDGSDFSSGIYFYTLQANEFKVTKKMALVK